MSYNKIESLQSFHDNERQLKLNTLEELDLSHNLFDNRVLVALSGLSNLKFLDIRDNKIKGSINVKELDALKELEELDISGNALKEIVSPKGNRTLGKLKVARLMGVFVDRAASLLQLVEIFSSVKTLNLRGNQLNATISGTDQNLHESSNVENLLLDYSYVNNDILQSIGSLTSLRTLSLGDCGLTGALPTRGWCDLRNLEALIIGGNLLEGTLPSCLGNLSSLHVLDISDNQFTGNGATASLANLTLLRFVSLSNNQFQVPSLFMSFANHSHLKVLAGDLNKLVKEPTIQTWIPKFQLRVFRLSNCTTKQHVNELPKFLYYQYDLSIIDLSYNNFGGNIPSWLLENNTRLAAFLMAGNSFRGPLQLPSLPKPNLNMSIVDISNNKIQGPIPRNICSTFPLLNGLNLSYNAFEGDIPLCLGEMSTSLVLDLSYNQLSGGIPENLAKSDTLSFLRLSNNNMSGKIAPTLFTLYSLEMLYLDGNNFDGDIPDIDFASIRLSLLSDLDLSNNSLSGKLPRWIWNVSRLLSLALSNNQLEGPIPVELCYLDGLLLLDLSQNNFSGPIPSCFDDVRSIRHLHLSRNRLSGTLTNAFFNSSELVTLDLSENHLTGEIPSWFGTLSALSVLLLRANFFTGEIPIQLCEAYSLSIIDLAQNKLSGPIPSCLGNLTLEPNDGKYITNTYSTNSGGLYQTADFFGLTMFKEESFIWDEIYADAVAENHMEERVAYRTKGGYYTYKGKILEYMSGIDLSCNRLTGQIPLEIGNLTEIHSLNLSHNNLTGLLPPTFAMLKQIESLDLSHNNLSGRIPIQLTELNALAVFNVSYNNLSGSIPDQKAQFGTFDESSYIGNPFLCGPDPLHTNSTETVSIPTVPNASDDEDENGMVDMDAFLVTFLVSYAIMLMGIAAVLYINPYWRQAWFFFIEQCITACHFFLLDNLLKLSTTFGRRS